MKKPAVKAAREARYNRRTRRIRSSYAAATWKDPERRSKALERHRAALSPAADKALAAVRKAVAPEVALVRAGSIDLMERVKRLPVAARRVLYALVDPVMGSASMKEVARDAGVSYDVARALLLHEEGFLELVEEVRKVAWRTERGRLAASILQDATFPIASLVGVKDGGQIASGITEARKMAAAVVGLKVEEPKVTASVSKSETVHRFEGYPEAVLREFSATGQWNPAWGPNPLLKGR